MQYNVAELLKGPVGVTRQFEIAEEPGFALEGARLVGPLSGSVRLMRTQDGILAEVEIGVGIEAECSRCLRSVSSILQVSFADEYHPSVDIRTGFRIWPLPGEEPDEELMIGADHVLVLDEAVRQELEAAVPVQILCREACAGLCPKCGQDLNEGPCQCEPDQDTRWRALRDILDRAATD